MKIEITEVNGWSKTVELEKAITRLGRAPNADLQLASDVIDPIQFQILSSPELPTGCRIVWLSDNHAGRMAKPSHDLSRFAVIDIHDQDVLDLAGYRITFHLSLTSAILRKSNCIEASVRLNDTLLQSSLPLEGRIKLKNAGEKDACQFQVTCSGLPEDCIQIDPVPLLPSGMEEEIGIRILHRSTHPPAGFTELVIMINSPSSYPGEELVIRQGLYVAPVYKQSITITDDLAVPAVPAESKPAEPVLQPTPAAAEKDAVEELPAPAASGGVTVPEPEPPSDIKTVGQATGTEDDQGLAGNKQAVPETRVENSGIEVAAKDEEENPAKPGNAIHKKKKIQKPDATEFHDQQAAPQDVSPVADANEGKLPEKGKVKVVRSHTEEFWDTE